MEKSFLLRGFVFWMVIFLIASPVMILPFFIAFESVYFDPFLWLVLKGALLQSTLSSFLTLFLGVIGAFGLFRLQPRLKRLNFFTVVVLVPSFVPPIIFVALGVKLLGVLPSGLFGVVLFHCLMNVGLSSVIAHRIIGHRANNWVRDGMGLPVSQLKIARAVLSEVAPELRWLFFYFFVLFFFSFAIPFLVGGARYGGVEVFIYEKVLFYGQWAEALQYTLLFFTLVLLFSYILVHPQKLDQISDGDDQHFMTSLGRYWALLVPSLPVVFIVFGLMMSLFQNWSAIFSVEILRSFRGSLLISLLVGSVTFVFLSMLAFAFATETRHRWIASFVHPGWVVVGFGFLLMGGEGPAMDVLKISVALTVLYLPFLFRLSFRGEINQLRHQALVAESFPVSWNKTFFHVVWPQCLPAICLLSGVAAIWACGDFAMVGLLNQSSSVATLATDMQVLLANYRIEQSLLYLWPMLVVSLVVFSVFRGLSYVSCK